MDCKFCAQRRGSNAPGHGLLDAATLEQEILKTGRRPLSAYRTCGQWGPAERSDLGGALSLLWKSFPPLSARVFALPSAGWMPQALAMLKNCGVRQRTTILKLLLTFIAKFAQTKLEGTPGHGFARA